MSRYYLLLRQPGVEALRPRAAALGSTASHAAESADDDDAQTSRAVPLRVIESVTFAPGENRASRSAKRPSCTGSPLIAAISSSNDMPAWRPATRDEFR